MAAKKKTAKTTTDTIAKDPTKRTRGGAPKRARRPAPPPRKDTTNPDDYYKDQRPATVGEMMEGAAAEDKADAMTSQTSAHVKQCHLLVQEMDLLLRAARKETATHGTIRFELARVADLAKLASRESKKGLEVLDR